MGDMGAGFHLPPARFSNRKPVTFLDFQGRILRPSQFRSCTNDHRRREKMTYPTYDLVLEVGKYMILYHLRSMTLGA